MIVGELTRTPLAERKKFWIEKLQLPVQWREITEEQKQDPLVFLKPQGFDGLLLHPEFSEILFPASPRIAAEIMEAGFADSMIRENSKVWLRCFLREALRLLILKKSPRLDSHSVAYITGSDPMARMAAVVAAQLGFEKLVVVSSFAEQAQQFVENLKRLFFGLNVKILGENELTLQPNNGSLLLNTLSKEQNAVILEDLTYLNFLKKDGLVVDIPLDCEGNSLLDEALHVGIPLIDGVDVWGHRDFLFLQSLLGDNFKVDLSSYLADWRSFVCPEKQS